MAVSQQCGDHQRYYEGSHRKREYPPNSWKAVSVHNHKGRCVFYTTNVIRTHYNSSKGCTLQLLHCFNIVDKETRFLFLISINSN